MFGPSPDAGRLLGEGAVFWTEAARRLGLPAPPPSSETIRSATGDVVHGTFDGDNVLFDHAGAVSGVLDLEAARVGPSTIDVSGMAADLLVSSGDSLACA